MTKGAHPKKHRRKKNLIKKQKQHSPIYQKQTYRKTRISNLILNIQEHKLSEEGTIKAYLDALKESISLHEKYKELLIPQIQKQSSELEKKLYTSSLPKGKLEEFEKTYREIYSKLINNINSYKELERLEKI